MVCDTRRAARSAIVSQGLPQQERAWNWVGGDIAATLDLKTL
jgi:hypothetical protein